MLVSQTLGSMLHNLLPQRMEKNRCRSQFAVFVPSSKKNKHVSGWRASNTKFTPGKNVIGKCLNFTWLADLPQHLSGYHFGRERNLPSTDSHHLISELMLSDLVFSPRDIPKLAKFPTGRSILIAKPSVAKTDGNLRAPPKNRAFLGDYSGTMMVYND